jgi:23S rRNA pseudouridine1911/1915/1917 synthase
MTDVYDLVVETAGLRLDRYVSEKCPEISRTYAQKLISDGLVKVNESPAKASQKLDFGDRVKVELKPELPSSLSPEPIPLNIVYEDADVMVVDKPAGMTVHPAPGHPAHTLVNAILAHLPELNDAEDTLRPGIVHRLDKDTSGLIIVAKNRVSQANLSAQFQSRTVKKVYLALVKGRLAPETGVIEAAIGRDRQHRQRMAVVTKGRQAQTDYQVIRYLPNYTLLEVRPATGRTHQIRVHLAAIGHPIVGDTVYGEQSPYIARQFLHAARLRFKQPSTGAWLELESAMPDDMEKALREIPV